MWKPLPLAFATGTAAAAAGLALDGSGVFSDAAAGFAEWLLTAGIAADGATSAVVLRPLGTVLAAFFAAWICAFSSRVLEVVWVPVATALLVVTGSVVSALLGVLVSPFAALVACGVVLVLGLGLHFSSAGARVRKARALLGGRAAPGTLSRASGSGSGMGEPVRREVSVVTVRLLSVDDLVETLDPRAFAEVQGELAKLVRTKLLAKGAVLDASAPDCVRGIFGAFGGEETARHAEGALRAAVEVRDAVRGTAKQLSEKYREEIRVGIGFDVGEAVVGTFHGAAGGGSFAASGGVVDFGRRLAGANAIYGSRLLIGAGAERYAGGAAALRPMEMLSDPSSGGLAEVYEVLGFQGELSDEAEERRERFWKAVVLYREGKWEEALGEFERARSGEVTDSPLEYFIGLARRAFASEAPGGAAREPRHARSLQTL